MSKIKKVLTEDHGQAKYFRRAFEKVFEDLLEVYNELDGQTKYDTNKDFQKRLESIKKQLRFLEDSFDDIIDIMAKEE